MLQKIFSRLGIIGIAYCLSNVVLLAQTPAGSGSNDWNNVLRIKPSVSLKVELLNGAAIRGKFVRAEAQSITLRIDKIEHSIPKENVGRITQISHRWLWVGVAAGIGAGVAWRVSDSRSDIAQGEYFGHTGRNFAHYYIPAVGGTVAGALVDMTKRPIYKVPDK